MGVTNKTPEFLALNPLGKVPTLEVSPGVGIFESNAIASYVARVGSASSQLLGGENAVLASKIDAWCAYANNHIDLPRGAWLYPILGYIGYSKAGTRAAKKDVKAVLATLNAHLEGKVWLETSEEEGVSLADIVVACSLMDLYAMVLEKNVRDEFPATTAWFERFMALEQVQAVVSDFKMCEKAAVYKAPAAADAAAASE